MKDGDYRRKLQGKGYCTILIIKRLIVQIFLLEGRVWITAGGAQGSFPEVLEESFKMPEIGPIVVPCKANILLTLFI